MEKKNEIIIEVEQVAPVKAKKGRKPKNPDAKPKERTEAQKEAQRNYYLTKLKMTQCTKQNKENQVKNITINIKK